MKKHLSLLILVSAVVAGGCATSEPIYSDLDLLKKRSVEREFSAAVRSGSVAFYAIGSLLDGYSLPGLTKEEAARVERESLRVVTAFATDPEPIGVTKEYWDAAEQFASAYNRMVYRYFTEKRPNQPLHPTTTAVIPAAEQPVRQP